MSSQANEQLNDMQALIAEEEAIASGTPAPEIVDLAAPVAPVVPEAPVAPEAPADVDADATAEAPALTPAQAKKAAADEAKAKKAAEKAEAAAKKKAEKEAAEKAKADAKAAKEAEKAKKAEPKPAQPSQNGVTMPKPDTNCGKIWALANKLSAAKGAAVTKKELAESSEATEFHQTTIGVQYYKWKTFYGIVAATPAPVAEAPAVEPVAVPEAE